MSEDSTKSDDEPVDDNLPNEEEPEEPSEEELDEDPFPDDTPVSVKRRAQTFRNRLEELGVTIHAISRRRIPEDEESAEAPEAPDAEDMDDEENGELDSVALQCQYNRTPFLIIFPVGEQFAIFQSDYDVLEDMIYSSPDDNLGGDFEPLDPQERWEAHQTVRQSITPEQVIGLCRANRSIPIPQLEAWFSILRTVSDRFTVETTRVELEYIGGIATRRLYTNPNNLTTQELYDTISQLLSLRQAIYDVLSSSYILGGIEVPDNFATLHPDVEETPRDEQSQPYNKGFQ